LASRQPAHKEGCKLLIKQAACLASRLQPAWKAKTYSPIRLQPAWQAKTCLPSRLQPAWQAGLHPHTLADAGYLPAVHKWRVTAQKPRYPPLLPQISGHLDPHTDTPAGTRAAEAGTSRQIPGTRGGFAGAISTVGTCADRLT
jgi:hypothetical protein